jgi:hypothetical protein
VVGIEHGFLHGAPQQERQGGRHYTPESKPRRRATLMRYGLTMEEVRES